MQTIEVWNLTLKAPITKVKEDTNNKARTLFWVTNTLTHTTPLSTHNTHLRPQTNTHHTLIPKTAHRQPAPLKHNLTMKPLLYCPTTPDTQVLLLMVSNGVQFLNPEILFPGQRVTTKRCNNTDQALCLLTGTNDSQSQRHRTYKMLPKERALLPESRYCGRYSAFTHVFPTPR